jgi:hypothetical protein
MIGCDMRYELRRKSAEVPVLAGLVAVAVCLRLPGLSASFYGDESFSLLRDSNQLITPTEDRFRPIFFSLLYLWKQLGFHGEAGLRALPALFGVLQVPVAFRLGLLMGGFEVATGFGALVAVNPMLIEFSQELRMYSLVPLIALLQAWAFAAILSRSAASRSTVAPSVAFVAAGVAGVYTHFHYWFLIVGFGFAMLRRYQQLPLRQSLPVLAAIGLLYLPNVPNLLRFQREAADAPHLRATDLWSALPKLVAADCVGFDYFPLPHLGIDRAIRSSLVLSNPGLSALVAIPSILLVCQLVRLHKNGNLSSMLWLSHELFTVPALVSFVAVLVMGRDFIHPKYMVFSAPFLLLLLTATYFSFHRRSERLIVGAMGLAVFSISIVHFNQPQEYGRREDWRGVTAYLRSVLDDQSTLLWLGDSKSSEEMVPSVPPQSLWDYYGSDLVPRIRSIPMREGNATPEELTPILTRLARGKSHAYYLWEEIRANVNDPQSAVITTAREIFANERTIQYNPRFVLYEWDVK